MQNLLDLTRDIMMHGEDVETRSGTVRRVFDRRMEWDLREGYPLTESKRMPFKTVMGELLWFLGGHTDLPSLRRLSELPEDAWTIWTDDCTRWHANGRPEHAESDEDLGRLYGYQWRRGGVDQIQNLIDKIKTDPTSRYLKVVTWNSEDVANNTMALPPCHTDFTVFVQGEYLDLKWRQRSVDTFLGLPFNIASYAALLEILAELAGKTARYLKADLDDVHIYHNHFDAVDEFLERPEGSYCRLAVPVLDTLEDLSEMTASAFSVIDYNPEPAIKAPLSVG